jgi:hypothetical protein
MLRGALIFLGLGIAAIAVAPTLIGSQVHFLLFGIGAVLVLATIFERIVYKPLDISRPGPVWQATPERFVDPTSGKQVTEFVNSATGERRYVDKDWELSRTILGLLG